MRVLELFSGTGSVGKVCKELGWEVVSLDIDKNNNPDICSDILDWTPPEEFFDVIWASPPCHTFSLLRKSWIGRQNKTFGNKTITREMLHKDMIQNGLPILHKTLDVIAELNPTYWFIENPFSSEMKNYIDATPYMVDYCRYSNWGYKKRTNIWTNLEDFEPKLCNKQCGNMRNGKHNVRIGRTDGAWEVGTNLRQKYRIPPNLIKELFTLIVL
tara:strand:+ start:711 stop:1352 length:642 start_codon:yes stop_codon:yes gene_type:complete